MTQAKIVEVDETWESETLSPVGLAHLLPKIVNKGFTVEVEGHAFPGQAKPTPEAIKYSKNLTVECPHRNQEHSLDGRIWCIDCGDIVRDADEAEAAESRSPRRAAPAERMPREPMIAPASRDDGLVLSGGAFPTVGGAEPEFTPTEKYRALPHVIGNKHGSPQPEMELTGKKRKRGKKAKR